MELDCGRIEKGEEEEEEEEVEDCNASLNFFPLFPLGLTGFNRKGGGCCCCCGLSTEGLRVWPSFSGGERGGEEMLPRLDMLAVRMIFSLNLTDNFCCSAVGSHLLRSFSSLCLGGFNSSSLSNSTS